MAFWNRKKKDASDLSKKMKEKDRAAQEKARAEAQKTKELLENGKKYEPSDKKEDVDPSQKPKLIHPGQNAEEAKDADKTKDKAKETVSASPAESSNSKPADTAKTSDATATKPDNSTPAKEVAKTGDSAESAKPSVPAKEAVKNQVPDSKKEKDKQESVKPDKDAVKPDQKQDKENEKTAQEAKKPESPIIKHSLVGTETAPKEQKTLLDASRQSSLPNKDLAENDAKVSNPNKALEKFRGANSASKPSQDSKPNDTKKDQNQTAGQNTKPVESKSAPAKDKAVNPEKTVTKPTPPANAPSPATIGDAKKALAQAPKQVAKKDVKAEPIRVGFYTASGKKIADDFVFAKPLDTELTAKDLPEITGYKFKAGLASRPKVTDKEQYFKLTYEANSVVYHITPVTADMKVITQIQKSYRGLSGSEVKFFPNVKGYQVSQARTYTIPSTPNEDIKVVYVPIRQTIRVIYQTDTGEVLSEEHLSGKTGETYAINLSARHFDGYELKETPNNLSGIFSPDNMDVKVVYEPVMSSIEINFLDQSGNQIHKPLEEKGRYKSDYLIQLPTIDGYELTSKPDLLEGRFGLTTRKVVLRFKPSQVTFKIHYWLDEDKQNKAIEDKVVDGFAGDVYTVPTPILQGYKPDPKIIEGKFSPFENPDLDVVYHHVECEARVDFRTTDGSLIKGIESRHIKGYWGDPISFALPDVIGYSKPEQTFNSRFHEPNQVEAVYYTPLESIVNINFINAHTKTEIAGYPAKQTKGLVGTAYAIEPEVIDGFHLTELPEKASGIYTSKPQTVDFMYEPNLSELVLHHYDSTLNSLAPNTSLKGYYGEKYQIKPDEALSGYTLVSSSYPMEGLFPPNRQDVDLYYKAEQVSFELIPANQHGETIDSKYNIVVTGMMNQTFSERMPEIPGYDAKFASVEDTIKPEYANKKINIPYLPRDSEITIASFYEGGNYDGQRVFEDEVFTGKVGDALNYTTKTIKGYKADMDAMQVKFVPESQLFTITYEVEREDYLIHFKDENQTLVGGMPQGNGYYDEAIDISQGVPDGFHLLNSANSKIHLDGSGVYNVVVNPDAILVDVVPQTADGVSLSSPRQIAGEYHVPQTVEVPTIPGFDPVDGDTVTITFELGQTTLPVIYNPQPRKITAKYISVEGNIIHEPTVVNGFYQERYQIDPLKIDGYFPINPEPKTGIYGLSDAEAIFIYRAGSDEFSRAVTPLSEIINEQNGQGSPEPSTTTNVGMNTNSEPPMSINTQDQQNVSPNTLNNDQNESSNPSSGNFLDHLQ